VTLLASALTLNWRTASALFGVAASATFLLFIGIHNAWDAVTYIAMDHKRELAGDASPAPPASADVPPPA
jgi:hypothetical protein